MNSLLSSTVGELGKILPGDCMAVLSALPTAVSFSGNVKTGVYLSGFLKKLKSSCKFFMRSHVQPHATDFLGESYVD